MQEAMKHPTAETRRSRARHTVVEYSISDSGVASVTAARVLQLQGVKSQLEAVKELRLSSGSALSQSSRK